MSLRRGASPSSRIISPLSRDQDREGAGANNNQNVALIMNQQQQQQHTDMSSSDSPYVNAATFEPTKEEVQDLKQSQQRWNAIVFTTGLSAFFLALLSITSIGTTFVFVCFIWPLVLGPYMIHQRRYLNRYPTLRRLINRVRFQVNRLQIQNNKFAAENARLEHQLTTLQQTEFQLHQLCVAQGTNVTELQALIKENGTIQKEMKVGHTDHIMQFLKEQTFTDSHNLFLSFFLFTKTEITRCRRTTGFLQAILMSDSNMDAALSDEEMHHLTLRLKCFNVVDEERLKQALRMTMLSGSSTEDGFSHTRTSYYDVHPQEQDVEIVTRGAFSGVDGWLV
jgi:hypothetical protein